MSPDTRLKGLYAITDTTLCGDQLVLMVEQALQGGASVIQYRDKANDNSRRLEQARALATLCRQYDALLIINDDITLAKAAGAHGVHLGKDDDDMEGARNLLGQEAIIGISCYNNFELAKQAEQAGADYIAFGRFFPSSTKPLAVQANLALLQRGKSELNAPMVAIGGITPENGGTLIEAGADMLAVVHAVFGQEQIQTACKNFTALFDMEENPS